MYEKYVNVDNTTGRTMIDVIELKNVLYDQLYDLKDINVSERLMLRKIIDLLASIDQTVKETNINKRVCLPLAVKQLQEIFSSKNRLQIPLFEEQEKKVEDSPGEITPEEPKEPVKKRSTKAKK